MKRSVLAVLFSLAVLLGCTQRPSRSATDDDPRNNLEPATPVGLVAEVSDTLRGTSLSGLIAPVWITQDRAGRYLAVDQSDRDIKVYDDRGHATASVGGPGAGPGQFRQLLGGGLLRDSVFGYDFADQHLMFFSINGPLAGC